jgi:hypothetical protein
MARNGRRDGPLQLRLVFLAVMLLLASTLGWLGWRLLSQDRELAKQRTTERQEVAADLAIAAFEKRFSAVEQDLGRILAGDENVHEDGALFVHIMPNGIRAWPEHGLLYFPKLPQSPEPSASLFAVADELEFRKQDRRGAIAALRSFANDADPGIRAAALVRIARNQLHSGDHTAALKTYERLSGLGAVVGGMPAAFAASIGKLVVFEQQHDPLFLLANAEELKRGLESGRWPISAATYGYLSQEISRFIPEKESRVPPGLVLAEGVEWLWEQWSDDPAKFASGRKSIGGKSGSVVLVWRASRDGVAAFVADARYLETRWLAAMKPQLDSRQVALALTNSDGGYVSGQTSAAGIRPAIRLSSATDLPWNVYLFSTTNADNEWRSRRNLLAAGMSVLMVLILTGGWFIGRTVSRELAVARLQSEFVSAVSHEFRTPLTALCQLSELLKRGRVASEGDREQYYELLHQRKSSFAPACGIAVGLWQARSRQAGVSF